jgi:glycosyltransferase involved in cell wall biosynthesis
MRIAFIGARGVVGKYSGIETYYEEVGSRLVQFGHKVTVYCRSYFTPPISPYRGMRVRRFPTVRSKHFETIVHSTLCTVDALFEGYDVVQYHALGSSPLAVLPRLAGMKTVVSVRGLDGEREKWNAVARRYLRACEWASAHCPSMTSVVSRMLLDYYVRRYQAKVTYIPNGVTLNPLVAPRQITQIGLRRKNYILYVGRLTPEKGCHHLIEAFRNLETDFKLVFVGGSTYASSYVERLKNNSSDCISFLGFQEGEILEELFSNAYLYVLPSNIEGLSISLLEAMSYGNCVLTSDIPENLELVEKNGFAFKCGSVEDLRQKMTYLIQNPGAAAESGRLNKQYIADNYTWDIISEKTEAFFRELLDQKNTGRLNTYSERN